MRQQPSRISRAFTIAELMIVLIILGVVLAVVLPSLKHVSARAKAAVSTTIMGSVGAAAGQFANDHEGRNPGYFTAAQMGNPENQGRGFPALANIMLDLMPGVTEKAAIAGNGVYLIGPVGTTGTVNVDLSQIGGSAIPTPGGSNKSYYRPDPKYFYSSVEPGSPTAGANAAQASLVPEHLFLPNLHDAYGSPILAWQEDTRAPTLLAGDTSDTVSARYYLASNQCFLGATALGKLQTNQVTGSMIGGNGPTGPQGNRAISLGALLGNPAFPGSGAEPPRGRGPIVFHSAGANGVFMGVEERGAKTSGPQSGARTPLPYIPGVDPMKGGDFDDIVLSAGN